MIPGLSSIPGIDDLDLDDGQMDWTKAIIYSMTEEERTNPDIISQSRRRRIAAGSGRSLTEVNGMIKQFNESKKMMGSMTGGKGSGKMEKMMNQLSNKPGGKGKGKGKKMPGLGDLGGLGDLFGGGAAPSGSQQNQRKRRKKKKIRRKR